MAVRESEFCPYGSFLCRCEPRAVWRSLCRVHKSCLTNCRSHPVKSQVYIFLGVSSRYRQNKLHTIPRQEPATYGSAGGDKDVQPLSSFFRNLDVDRQSSCLNPSYFFFSCGASRLLLHQGLSPSHQSFPRRLLR